MMGRTHILLGISTLWAFTLVPGALTSETLLPLASAATLGALLPDLDAAQSTLKSWKVAGTRPLWLLADIIHYNLGHRGVLHSLIGLATVALFALFLAAWWGSAISVALVAGYASHLLGDSCTKRGIPLLYPRPGRFHLLPLRLRLTTGSVAEEVVWVLLALSFLFLLFRLSYQPMNFQLDAQRQHITLSGVALPLLEIPLESTSLKPDSFTTNSLLSQKKSEAP